MTQSNRKLFVAVLGYVLLVVGFLGLIGGLTARNPPAVLVGAFTVYWGMRFQRLSRTLPEADEAPGE